MNGNDHSINNEHVFSERNRRISYLSLEFDRVATLTVLNSNK